MSTTRYEPKKFPSLRTVMPIPGNSFFGAAVKSPQADSQKALYAVFNPITSRFEMYQTKGSYKSLATDDGSVEYISTIFASQHPGGKNKMAAWPALIGLTVIGGVIYATIEAKSIAAAGNDQEGVPIVTNSAINHHLIMRDTSSARDGTGPWVVHGRMPNDGWISSDNEQFGPSGYGGGEIMVEGGTWAVCHRITFHVSGLDGNSSSANWAISSSSDGGHTWTLRLQTGFYFLGGVFGYHCSRNYGKINGYYYVSGAGNASDGQTYKSANLVDWEYVAMGQGNSGMWWHPFSWNVDNLPEGPGGDDHDRIYCMSASVFPDGNKVPTTQGLVTYSSVRPDDAYAADYTPAFQCNLYALVDFGSPWIANVGYDDPEDGEQLWTAIGFGRVQALRLSTPYVRQYPRDDGAELSSAPRKHPRPQQQRVVGGYE